ncbi:MAG: fimbria/pilus outer membrane usher protein [Candidatus Geothermincolia bacterium]
MHGSVLFFLFVQLLLCSSTAAAFDELLLGVTLNEVDQGIFFAFRSAEGDLLFAEEDLHTMGFRLLPGNAQELGGKTHYSLRSLRGLTFDFDADAVMVKITAPPELLAMNVVDFLAGAKEDVEFPVARSAFLNYRVNYHAGKDFEFAGFDAIGEVGVRAGDLLLLSDALYRRTDTKEDLLRLMTRVSWEDREALQRLTLGDCTSAPGDLWASVSLGGLSFSKLYRIDPYQIRYPTFGLAGQAPLPAEVRVYLDGVLVRTEKLAPGEFDIRNLYSYGGNRQVDVVIKDIFGRETRISRPFYFTDAVLRRGFHEYSYNLGWAREKYGEESNRYGSLALSAFHRYGLTDFLTLGLAGEAIDGIFSVGPTLSLVAGQLGAFSLALSAGRMDGEDESAGVVAHEYQGKHLNTRVRFRRSSAEYRTISDTATPNRAGAQFEAGVGFGTRGLGTLTFNYSAEWLRQDADRTRVSADYSIGLFGKVSLYLSVGRTDEGTKRSTDFSAGLSYNPGERWAASTQYRKRDGVDQTTLDVSHDLDTGEGLTWRAAAESLADGSLTLRPSAAYHGQSGIWAGNFELQRDAAEQYQSRLDLSAAGSVLVAGGKFGLSRPVQDSFALVKVGKDESVPGIRVYQGGSLRGVTGHDGTLFVPEIGSYVHNQISIEPEDIPLGYSIDRVTRVIAPGERSGSVVAFDVARYQAVTGKLFVREAGGRYPMEYIELEVQAGEQRWSVPSGKDGEFFLENVGTGLVSLSFRYNGRDRSCEIIVPESEEIIADLGDVTCKFFGDVPVKEATKSVSGWLFVREKGERHPVENRAIRVRSENRDWVVSSGSGGSFMLENVPIGMVGLSFRDDGHERSCDIVVPESEEGSAPEGIIDIGEVSCELFP